MNSASRCGGLLVAGVRSLKRGPTGRSRQWIAVLVLFLLTLGPSSAFCGELIFFGDSLTDTGNLYIVSQVIPELYDGIFDPANPYSRFPTPPYVAGRATNGSVWVESLATRMGCTNAQPSLAGGTNYAFISALTRDDPLHGIVSPFGVPDLGTQITDYLATHTPHPTDVFVIWGGANDFFFGQQDPSKPVEAIAEQMARLADNGAKRFVVLNLPPLGDTPSGAAANPAGLNTLCYAFNMLLDVTLDDLRASLHVTICEIDVDFLFQVIQRWPEWFGFVNITEPALATVLDPSSPLFGFPQRPLEEVDNPMDYLFWDGVHPTQSGHQLIADYVRLSLAVSSRRRH